MKKSGRILLFGTAAAAAVCAVQHADKLEPAKVAAGKALCRANSLFMDAALKLMPEITPAVEEGVGCSARIPEALARFGLRQVLLVTGPTVGKTMVPPIRDAVLAAGIGCVVFDAVEANPSVETVERIRLAYLQSRCDGFLAVGGGSPIDAAKAAAARIARPDLPVSRMGGVMKVHTRIPTVIAVPTTAGTGSEATMGAVITDHATQHKYAVMDPCVTPRYAFLDAALTVSMPPFVTATTGVDALTHAVESYVTWAYNTNASNRNAEAAVVKIFRYLEKAYADGTDLEAREQMLLASYRAGLAFNRAGLGYVHAIAHALGGLYNTPHGLANAVILPIVLEDYGAAVHPQLAHLAELTGVMTTGTDAEKAAAFIAAIRGMNDRMGLPRGLDIIREGDFDRIVRWALREANRTYPVPVLYDAARCRRVLSRIRLGA